MSETSSAPSTEAGKPATRLCYVDDSRTAAFVMRRMLEPHGYQVDYFQSAEPAMVALIQEDYDLLLTDLKVSSTGMDGDDLIRTLRQSGTPKLTHLPIIVITGTSDAEVLVKVYDAGANQVMTKPVDSDALDGHIRRLLAERREPPASPPDPEPSEAAPAAAEIPVVTPIRPPTAKAGDRPVPVLQPATAPRPPQPEPKPASIPEDRPLTADDAPSLIERAIDTARGAAASEGPSDTAAERQDESPSEPTERAAVTDDSASPRQPEARLLEPEEAFEEYEGEVEVIIDPEKPAARRRRGRQQQEEELLFEISRFAPDDQSPYRAGRRLRIPPWAWLLLLLAALGGGGYLAWQNLFAEGPAVQTMTVPRGEIYQSLVLPGQVVSQRQVVLGPTGEGVLLEVLVGAGDRVEADQLLARMDDSEARDRLRRAEADLAGAREEVALAERTFLRLRDARSQGSLDGRFVQEAEDRLASARARALQAAEGVHEVREELERLKITAPFAGTIVRRQAEAGQRVRPADALFTLAGDGPRQIEVRAGAGDRGRFAVGQLVLVTSAAFPGREWEERVTEIGEAAGGDSVPVHVSLGPEAPELPLGEAVDAEIRVAWNPHAVKVPFEALIRRDGKTHVALLIDGRVRLQPVITGIEDFSMAEVRQGLKGGERIILPRGQPLEDGQRVRPVVAATGQAGIH